MDELKERTYLMVMHGITWNEVADKMRVSRNQLYVWRHGDDKIRHEAIRTTINIMADAQEFAE